MCKHFKVLARNDNEHTRFCSLAKTSFVSPKSSNKLSCMSTIWLTSASEKASLDGNKAFFTPDTSVLAAVSSLLLRVCICSLLWQGKSVTEYRALRFDSQESGKLGVALVLSRRSERGRYEMGAGLGVDVFSSNCWTFLKKKKEKRKKT